MDLQFQCTVPQHAAQLLEPLGALMHLLGYAPSSAAPLRFRRGVALLTPFRFSPRDWYVEVTVLHEPTPAGTHLTLHYAVSTFGQWVTEPERAFFQAESEEVLQALLARRTVLNSPGHAELAKRRNYAVVAGAAAPGALLGGLVVLLRHCV